MKLRSQYCRLLAVLTLSGIIMFSQSGCRFGNHVEPATPTDTITGYYGSAPQEVQLFATYNFQTVAKTGTVNDILGDLKSMFTHPSIVFVVDQELKDAVICAAGSCDPYNSPLIRLESDLTFESFGPWATAHWQDCPISIFLRVKGGLNSEDLNSVLSGYRISGRLAMDVDYEIRFASSNSCTDALDNMYGCYQNINACQFGPKATLAKNRELVQILFEPFIRLQGMTAEDIRTTGNLTYKVSYR